MTRLLPLCAAFIIGLTATASAEGDATAGAKIFNRCKACHAADKPQNKVGPHLVGIAGRAVATLPDFKYSDAMKAKGAEGAVWDDATMAGYFADPKGFIPDNKMAFSGLKKPEDIANVIAYLKSLPKP